MAEIRHFPGFQATWENVARKVTPEEQPAPTNEKYCVYNQTRGRFVATSVEAVDASSGGQEVRLRNLEPGAGAGLWLMPCPEISPTSIRFLVDLVYLNREGAVLAAVESFPLVNAAVSSAMAGSVLVLAENTVAAGEVHIGDRLIVAAPDEMKRHLQTLKEAKAAAQACLHLLRWSSTRRLPLRPRLLARQKIRNRLGPTSIQYRLRYRGRYRLPRLLWPMWLESMLNRRRAGLRLPNKQRLICVGRRQAQRNKRRRLRQKPHRARTSGLLWNRRISRQGRRAVPLNRCQLPFSKGRRSINHFRPGMNRRRPHQFRLTLQARRFHKNLRSGRSPLPRRAAMLPRSVPGPTNGKRISPQRDGFRVCSILNLRTHGLLRESPCPD